MTPANLVDPERALAMAYAPRAARPVLTALWALDEQLGAIVSRTETPAVGQMRLTWWHEALRSLRGSQHVDPMLVTLSAQDEIEPSALLPIVEGWEILLEPLPLPAERLNQYADLRGGCLFEISAQILGQDHRTVRDVGRHWALVDLAFRMTNRLTAERALSQARGYESARPKAGPLAALSALARRDARQGLDRRRRKASPARVLRAMIAGITGL